MPEHDSQTVMILLSTAVGLLVLLVALMLGVRRRLGRLERRLDRPESPGPAFSPAETTAGGAFEMFLGEDPARRDLPKGEQLAEYRKWRQEKGLNWSNS